MLPYELTNFPVADMIVLRRLDARDDPDIQFLIRLFAEVMSEVIAEFESLHDELEKPRPPISPGRLPFGERKSEMVTVKKILRLRKQGKSLGEIARKLNTDGCLTATGKRWRPQTVKNVITRYASSSSM
jgi:hypothetical protein